MKARLCLLCVRGGERTGGATCLRVYELQDLDVPSFDARARETRDDELNYLGATPSEKQWQHLHGAYDSVPDIPSPWHCRGACRGMCHGPTKTRMACTTGCHGMPHGMPWQIPRKGRGMCHSAYGTPWHFLRVATVCHGVPRRPTASHGMCVPWHTMAYHGAPRHTPRQFT